MSRNVLHIIIIVLLSISACTSDKEQTRELMKEAYIDSRLEQFERFKNEKCEALILEKAEVAVSEDILQRARELTNENLEIFNKPSKPEKPATKQMKDSLEIAPLIPDSIK